MIDGRNLRLYDTYVNLICSMDDEKSGYLLVPIYFGIPSWHYGNKARFQTYSNFSLCVRMFVLGKNIFTFSAVKMLFTFH